ncbi:NAD(P)-dependent oxidoreductase [Salipiger bermudensis]|uniref:NAD-dependent epimerase/dehydratase family protein n=1 Tax=Salipiger bermudensis TaxID=344736 RepID=UPI001C997222|nr:NAD(P)-dependent oxidoreductase [Salipiger bermudensis]MBY6006601.1 NAD(P)-dependent oxidoreductase [Salipiger bermudensis]
MTRLVTGASGFLGGKLVQKLVHEGARDIVLLTRTGADLGNLPKEARTQCKVVVADDTQSIIETVRDLAPEIVYHCASRVLTDYRIEDVDDLIRSNLGLFTALLEGLARSDLQQMRIVNLGTYLEHDASGAPDPNSLYAATKLAQAQIAAYYARGDRLRMITLKPSLIYGPGERRPRLMRLLIDAALEGRRLELSPGEQVLDFIHVDDVVSAVLAAGSRIEAGAGAPQECYFVLSGEAASLRNMVGRIERVTGLELDVAWGAKPYKATEVMHPYLDGPRLPGWTPSITLEHGVLEMLQAARSDRETREI